MGVMQGGMTAGGVLGPLFGGLLADQFGMRMAFFIAAAALFLITLALLFFVKEEPRKPDSNAKPVKIWDFSLCKIPAVKRMLICAGVVQLTILMQQPIMPLYVAELQGSMERIRLDFRHCIFSDGYFGRLSLSDLGHFGSELGLSTRTLSVFARCRTVRYCAGFSEFA